ncbi:MAG: hypothetical protein ABIJ05_03230 [Patescibacteria group bacterium]
MVNKENGNAVSKEPMFIGERPLSPTDRLAYNFPKDKFAKTELVGQLISGARGMRSLECFRDWTLAEEPEPLKKLNKEEQRIFEMNGWNPHIVKFEDRWLVTVNRQTGLRFGIDSLKLGLENTINFGGHTLGKELLPYIHFKEPKNILHSFTGDVLKEYGVDYTDFILLNTWQFEDLKSIVESVE